MLIKTLFFYCLFDTYGALLQAKCGVTDNKITEVNKTKALSLKQQRPYETVVERACT